MPDEGSGSVSSQFLAAPFRRSHAPLLLGCNQVHRATQSQSLGSMRLNFMRTCWQVLFSRHVGELRQGRWVDPTTFSWPDASLAARSLLLNAKRSEPDYKQHAQATLQQLCIDQPQFRSVVPAA